MKYGSETVSGFHQQLKSAYRDGKCSYLTLETRNDCAKTKQEKFWWISLHSGAFPITIFTVS